MVGGGKCTLCNILTISNAAKSPEQQLRYSEVQFCKGHVHEPSEQRRQHRQQRFKLATGYREEGKASCSEIFLNNAAFSFQIPASGSVGQASPFLFGFAGTAQQGERIKRNPGSGTDA